MSCPHETSRPNSKPDLYSRVTNAIIAELENGVRPWTKPWSTAHAQTRITRPLRHNGEPYSGINVVLLWCEAVARGFANATWMTFRQAQSLGAHIRKGETGSLVVYANRMIRTWDESAVTAGDEFQSVIAERLDRANLILLLVSSIFLASERLYNGQLQLAMKRFRDGKAVICPILVRPCLYEGAVFSKLHTLLPRNKVAVADWKNPDNAYEHIAQQISQFVDTLIENLKTP